MPPSRGRRRKPMGVSSAPITTPTECPKTPSPPHIPQGSTEGVRRWAGIAANWIFRGLTLLSVGYLVFDRIYETSAFIYPAASDPQNPFIFPFTITNQSHLFPIDNLKWGCEIEYMHTVPPHEYTVANSRIVSSTTVTLPPGASLNIRCNAARSGRKERSR